MPHQDVPVRIRIPPRFYDFCAGRGYPVPDIITRTDDGYIIDLDDSATSEILGSAEFYTSFLGPPIPIGLRSSAVTTIGAIREALGPLLPPPQKR